ncbi:MAG TPA: ABC transporter ATP-binding protein [Actinomycetota bacterium]|nr:ABC transporter ATP-binding protein [Actinomycetota bacterium]
MALLQAEGIEVRFGGLHALKGVDLEVEAGGITGLIGPNGAGKTTFFNVVCGLQSPTAGRVLVEGKDVGKLKAHRRARLGIGRTFQRLEVFSSMTVLENVLTGAEIRKSWSRDRSSPREIAQEVLTRLHIEDFAEERADSLPTGLLRIVELGRALATRPRLLLLDEPSSGLNQSESHLLASLLKSEANAGLGVLLVEHHIELVMEVCRDIFVLDFGSILARGTPDEIQNNEAVQRAYLGKGVNHAA